MLNLVDVNEMLLIQVETKKSNKYQLTFWLQFNAAF